MNPKPNLTIISHSDNEHPQADDVIYEILQIIQTATPIVVSIISAAQSKTITLPAKTNG